MKIMMVFLAAVFLHGTAVAQELVIYPAKGQSNEQTEKDKYACYSWAKGQTGFDPMVAPQATIPPPAQQQKSVVGGAVVGGVGRCGPRCWHRSDCRWFARSRKRSGDRCAGGRHPRRSQKPLAKPTGAAGAKAVRAEPGGSIPAGAK